MTDSSNSGRRETFPLPSLQPSSAHNPAPNSPTDQFEGAPDIRIEVVALKPYDAGNLKAFADVKFGKWIIIRGFRVVAQPGQRAWVGLPSNQREEPDPQTGQRKRVYFGLISISKKWQAAAEQAVLTAYQDYLSSGFVPIGQVIGGSK